MSAATTVRAVLWRTLLLAVAWWTLAEGDTSVLVYGLVLVPIAVAVSLPLVPLRPSRGGLVRRTGAGVSLLGWFLWQSVRGGVDVARRAVSVPVDLDEAVVEYAWRVEDRGARVLVAGINGLMPGTLSVDIGRTHLHLHVLDRDLAWEPQLAELERRVAAVLGVHLRG